MTQTKKDKMKKLLVDNPSYRITAKRAERMYLAEYGEFISRATVVAAFNALKDEGFASKAWGKGRSSAWCVDVP